MSTWRGTGDADTVRDAVNAHLRPHPVAILARRAGADEFDARFSAVKRHYLYRIVNRRADLTLERGCAPGASPRRLDAEAMQAAAQRLVGQHDFTTFRSAECQAKSPVKTLDPLDVTRDGDEIHITASARSFLHNQVRSMVGSLVLVGDGKWRADDLAAALAARDRAACGPVAPPDGLYLMKWITEGGSGEISFQNGSIDRRQRREIGESRRRSSTWCMVVPTRPNSSTGQ